MTRTKKRKSPIKHIVHTHKRRNKVVYSYIRGSRIIQHKLANPLVHSNTLTLEEFNKKIRTGVIPLEKVRLFRFWYKNGSFQDFPGCTIEDAKSIFKNYKYGTGKPISITSPEFITQQYRAFLESEPLLLPESSLGSDEFDKKYLENKKKRGITRAGRDENTDTYFWKFKGKEYNNVGIPKEVYLKAIVKRKEEIGF